MTDKVKAKLYFYYGTVGSAKTLNLLAVAHKYEQQNKQVLVVKPAFDTRFGYDMVRSRAGLERQADIILPPAPGESLFALLSEVSKTITGTISCLLVDEVQFLTTDQIDELREYANEYGPVVCYGLRTDFRRKFFEGSQRLLEVADCIEEVKTTCHYSDCVRKAIFNIKLLDGKPTLQGPSCELGAEEKYLPVCATHYDEMLGKG